MKLIFRIAAVTIIALLAMQIYTMKYTIPEQQEKMGDIVDINNNLRNKIHILSVAASRYYKESGQLPQSLDDLTCAEWSSSRSGAGELERVYVECAEFEKDGIFYVKYKDSWASFEAYIEDNDFKYSCGATVKLCVGECNKHCDELRMEDIADSISSHNVQ